MEFGCMSPKIITDGWFASQRSMIVIAVSHFHVYISSSLVEAFSKHKLHEGLLTALCSHLEHRDVVLGQVELQQRGEEELGQQPGLGEAEARVDTEPAQEGSLCEPSFPSLLLDRMTSYSLYSGWTMIFSTLSLTSLVSTGEGLASRWWSPNPTRKSSAAFLT